jgi:hypothetical protein
MVCLPEAPLLAAYHGVNLIKFVALILQCVLVYVIMPAFQLSRDGPPFA